ncbi:Putative cytochrome P450 132 [Acaryochloris thomasi RCC1774]|uniref:Cytochrome P450 132 n=1 Tax=Acaryochloris thomasi RCC1774 TaxID=1764569 RepID=A0A2W1JPN0_9CYAN|nr:cytochrome P450 [Acaryochloris thomasi]PZD70847.1 Putative cytochrome P450 132 [Acaryochloris thomasi RCC1774]
MIEKINSHDSSTIPEGVSGLTAIRQLVDFCRNPIDYSVWSANEYGDAARIKIASTQIYLLNHPDFIAEVLNQKNKCFIKDVSYRMLARLLGDSLLLSDGEQWKRHRRMMQPAFTQERIAEYAATVIEETNQLLSNWKIGGKFNLHQVVSQLTIKIITNVLFGSSLSAASVSIGKALDAIILQYYHQAQTGFLVPSWFPTPSNRKASSAIKYLNEIVENTINQRYQSSHDDLFSVLLGTQDGDSPFSVGELRGEVMTLLLAGHETTASALAWALMLLAQHPKIANKLRAEAQAAFGQCLPNINDLEKLPYTQMVLKESMRLYPPAWALSREVAEDCQIGPYFLTKGTTVYFSQWVVHRDKRFFDNPGQFRPERWNERFEKHLPPGAYFPFGAGPRVCIGQAFSMMEATLILAMISQKFSLGLVPNQSIELLPSITLRPKNGINMFVDASF